MTGQDAAAGAGAGAGVGAAVAAGVTATTPAPPAVPPMPPGTTLKDLITPTGPPDANGISQIGTLSLDRNQLAAFQKAQTAIQGGENAPANPEQLATLWAVEHGQLPESERVAAAPPGTTVNSLVEPPAGQKPDANGMYHLGNLAVKSTDLAQFQAAQRDLCAKNPEALDVLNKLENGTRKYTLNLNDSANNTFNPNGNVISWDPHKDLRDQFNKSNLPPVTAYLHEEGHALGTPIVSQVLHNIPDAKYSNLEEKRVIEGIEARDMSLRNLPPRHSHIGVAYPVPNIDSISPHLTVTQNGHERSAGAGFQQSGKVDSVTADKITLDVGHNQKMELKTNELVGFMGSSKNVQAVLSDAKAHGDSVSFAISNDGKVTYQDAPQLQRFFNTPAPSYQLLATPAALENPNQIQRQPAAAGGVER